MSLLKDEKELVLKDLYPVTAEISSLKTAIWRAQGNQLLTAKIQLELTDLRDLLNCYQERIYDLEKELILK